MILFMGKAGVGLRIERARRLHRILNHENIGKTRDEQILYLATN